MAIRFIPNDPLAASPAPGLRIQNRRPNRPRGRAGFTFVNTAREGTYDPGTPQFLYWQCREAGLAALEAWEGFAGPLTVWQGGRRNLRLLQDRGVDLNAYYDRQSFSFFHQPIQNKVYYSGASTDVVAHEIGHGLLDAIRPQLWSSPFLESGALHEAFGDCLAVLTALDDRDTRLRLLGLTATLRRANFVEATAEELSDGIRRLAPNHNAAAPRRAFNTFQFQIPETLPDDGGPGELINEVHSFGMVFSGCFYDLIANIFAGQTNRTEATLRQAARTAGAILVGGARTASITPRYFQSVGRAMVLADQQLFGGAHRDQIGEAFQRHNIMLGTNALLAPTTLLEGRAPKTRRRGATLATSAQKDLAKRLGTRGARFSVEAHELGGQAVARVVHTQDVPLGSLDTRLRGVTIRATVPIIVGDSGRRAAVLGALPDLTATEREAQAFVASLLAHDQVAFDATRPTRGAVTRRRAAPAQTTHRVVSVRGKKVLERISFRCGCTRPAD
jgi:hypothetical protein